MISISLFLPFPNVVVVSFSEDNSCPAVVVVSSPEDDPLPSAVVVSSLEEDPFPAAVFVHNIFNTFNTFNTFNIFNTFNTFNTLYIFKLVDSRHHHQATRSLNEGLDKAVRGQVRLVEVRGVV